MTESASLTLVTFPAYMEVFAGVVGVHVRTIVAFRADSVEVEFTQLEPAFDF